MFNPTEVSAFVLNVGPPVHDNNGWVHSWGREPVRNTDVGGHPNSRHLDWCAVDVGFYNHSDREAAYAQCYANGLHGYKKDWMDPIVGVQVYGFHMQDRPGKVPS